MSIFNTVAELEKSGRQAALCVVVDSQGSTPRHSGSKMVVYADGSILGSVGGGETEKRVIQAALQALKTKRSSLVHFEMIDPSAGDPGVCGGQVSIYIEPILKPAEIILIGAGHVGKAVAFLAKWLGFRVVISDDRVDLCTSENIPGADLYLPGAVTEVLKNYEITENTFFVLTTRGSDVDVECLPTILGTPAGYIGIIGSKRRWLVTQKVLSEKGISQEKLKKIRSPIGLELRAETPEEIAVSILAEIIMLQNGGTGSEMSK